MPTIDDVEVDPQARSGDVTSPISQDPALNSSTSNPPSGDVTSPASQDPALNSSTSNPPAAGEADGAADGCPAILTGIYDCPKVEAGVVQDGMLGWVCHWCGK